ncbi:MAG: peptidyl-prolyl cis-trans isomerase [Calditrichia bacterium]|jgi:peptidyl-prolyl cis-trans isomerase C|nr:peptidyl-prolyl cis-trans isomerase [Calditrichia bacterium]
MSPVITNNIKVILSLLLISTGILITGCTNKSNSKGNVVAQVNEAQITNTELEAAIPEGSSPEVKLALKRNLMEKWIEEEIFYQVALEEGLSLSEQEMLLVKNYEKRLLVQKYIDTRLSHNYRILDQEVEDYYNKHQREFVWDDETVHIIHLVLDNDDSAIKSEIRQSKDLMEVIKKNFFDQQSTPERPIGDLGYQKLSEFPNMIQRRIRNLKTGNISGPIKTNYGYHYIQLLDFQKKGAIKEIDLARDEIYMRLQFFNRNEEIKNIKQSLRSGFTIQTDLSKLSEH